MVLAQNSEFEAVVDSSDVSKESCQTWMILKDSSEPSSAMAQELVNQLNESNQKIILVESGKTYKRLDRFHFSINLEETDNDEENFTHILSTLDNLDIQCDHIIHLMGFRWHSDDIEHSNIVNIQKARCASTISLLKSLAGFNPENFPSLKLITSGGATLSNESKASSYVSNPSQSALCLIVFVKLMK